MIATTITLVGLGEVGQVLAADLHRLAAADLRAWDRLFTDENSKPRSALRTLSFLDHANSMADAVAARALVISAVTAGACVEAAAGTARALPPGTFYLDLNSVSPRTKASAARIAEAAGRPLR